MFKYTPPWQVLCKSMEHELKKQPTDPTYRPQDGPQLTQEENEAVDIARHLSAIDKSSISQGLIEPKPPMENSPKKWVIKPLSPKLGTTNYPWKINDRKTVTERQYAGNYTNGYSYEDITVLRTQSCATVTLDQGEGLGGDVVVQGKQMAVVEDEGGLVSPISPESPGSRRGFYSFVEQGLEAGKTEAWRTSPEREAKLATLRRENGFEVRAYQEEKRPEKLFPGEDNEESRYKVPVHSLEKEIECDRRDIIRTQAPKKNPIFAEQWSSLEELDLARTLNNSSPPEEMSLYYSPLPPRQGSSIDVEPGSVDTEQINFSAARQQFLLMEKSNQSPFLQSPRQPLQMMPKSVQDSPLLEGSTIKAIKVHYDSPGESSPIHGQHQGPVKDVAFTMKRVGAEDQINKNKWQHYVTFSFDDLDSGLGDFSGDYGAGYTSDGSLSNELSSTPDTGRISKSKSETPIEREIRINQEREERLRQERGISRTNLVEMVDIKTKPVLSQASSANSPVVSRSKEKGRVSFFVQREIERETRREEDLHHEGKAPGLYDHGTPQELEERKKIFELQADDIPVIPNRMNISGKLIEARKSEEPKKAVPEAVLPAEGKTTASTENFSAGPCCPHRHPDEPVRELISQTPVHVVKKGSITQVQDEAKVAEPKAKWETFQPHQETFEPQTSSREPQLYPGSRWGVKDSPGLSDGRNSSELSGLRNASGLGVSDDLKPHQRALPELFNLRSRKLSTPDVIRQEIEEDLKREKDLRRLRWSTTIAPSVDLGQDTVDNQAPATTTRNLSTGKLEALVTPITVPSSQSLTLRTPGVSMVTAQPWAAPPWPESPSTPRSSGQPGQGTSFKGLTETLLGDFEERRIKMKREEGKYAGIEPSDDVNNEVLEATRVTRHKNSRALLWEAGLYSNEAEK
ncbi:mitotic interactor and substrate of PLK1 isoform X1 [Acipenser oxyrinchus oxyrinchus]|uniref:Mitotic interactor and substrate of PLK1 isoform X1 n=1 Tax=Acipenser oxyrinchus oxyrinchus TaxID=40147 RepID=A0AAD8CJ31_ACIOX|nr:mitotic interactor and substrate of PLK1 isoform X1 [Acipenser oxyrinchus oxyrinchus]